MAKMYYTLDEAITKLGCTEDQLRGLVRSAKLREFRDAGKVHYRVDDVDKLVSSTGDNLRLEESGELSIEDSQEMTLAKEDSNAGPPSKDKKKTDKTDPSLSGSGLALGDTDAPIELGGSSSGVLSLEGSGELGLEGSGELGLEGSGELGLEDSGSAAPLKEPGASGSGDAISLEDVDTEAIGGLKKDDTVITNIGISVFDDDDLEISADPMAKTVLTGSDEHMSLDGSGAGSGLLDLTRESDDTSLGADLLGGIDLEGTGESGATRPDEEAEPQADGLGLSPAGMEPVLAPAMVSAMMVEVASPAYTGLLIAATISLALAGAMTVANAMDTLPNYLGALAGQFWIFLAASLLVGGLFAGAGFLTGKQGGAPRAAKPKSAKKPKKGAKKGESQAEGEEIDLDEVETLK